MNIVDYDAANLDLRPFETDPENGLAVYQFEDVNDEDGLAPPEARIIFVLRHVQAKVVGLLDDLINEERIGANVNRRPFLLVQGTLEDQQADDSLAAPGVHFQDQLRLVAPPVEPGVPHFSLHVPRILVALRLRGQHGENLTRVQDGVGRVTRAKLAKVDGHGNVASWRLPWCGSAYHKRTSSP